MAKTGFWLRGAKGKLAGAALQKGANGETIIREVVTPSNPQTVAQMIQRTLMSTVGRAYSAMKEITDHSYEGYKKGQQTMAAFQQYNLRVLRDKVEKAVADGVDLYELYAFNPIGSNLFVVNEYQIARGSLPVVTLTATDEDDALPGALMALPENTYQSVIDTYGLQRGDQLTFVVINANQTDRNHTFHFARVILDPTNADGSQAALSAAFVSGGRINLPSVRNEGQFHTLSYADGQLKLNMGRTIAAAGCIVSRQNSDDTWRRSDARLVVMNPDNGYTLQESLDRGGSAGISTLNSQYLNNAGQGSVLQSGSSPAESAENAENGSGSGNSQSGSQSQQNSVAAPTISGVNPFEETSQVSISGPDGATIYYSENGDDPDANDTLYTQPFTIDETTTIKAIAIKDGVSSQVTTKVFTKGTGGSGGFETGS
jgi:hypothetical protein